MHVRTFSGAATVLLAVVLSSSAAAPQVPQPGPLIPFSFRPVESSRARTQSFDAGRLSTWIGAARRHTPGRWDDAAERVAGWTPGDLAEVLVDLNDLLARVRVLLGRSDWTSFGSPAIAREKVSARNWEGSPAEAFGLLVMTPEEARAGGIERLVERCALLHTDVGVLAAESASTQDIGHELARTSLHCGFAREIVRSLARSAPGGPFIRQWYRSVVGFLQMYREVASAPILAEEAAGAFPDDVYLVVSAGCIHETLGSPTVQERDYFRDSRLAPAIGSPAEHLQKAERYFRLALRLEPGMTEARVRLGRVLGGLGRHADALAELRAVEPPPADRFVAYFAALFLGDEEAAAGHRDLARAAYDRALGLYPSAQSGWLAASRLARALGDREGAIAAMRKAAEVPADGPTSRYDPWGDYNAGAGRSAAGLLHELRTPFEREP